MGGVGLLQADHYQTDEDTRKTTFTPANDSSAHTTASGELMKYSMQEAAQMWTITAKEGDPVAERELAIFYLTHPELVERVTAPLPSTSPQSYQDEISGCWDRWR